MVRCHHSGRQVKLPTMKSPMAPEAGGVDQAGSPLNNVAPLVDPHVWNAGAYLVKDA